MKKKLNSMGLTSKETKEIIDLIGEDPKKYSEAIKKVVDKYPQVALILPPPEEGFDDKLVKGAGLIARFGGFD